MEEKNEFTAQDSIMDRNIVPAVIYDENPDLIELYYGAWQSAWNHIFTCKNAPVETYMNEGLRCNHIWIWDTCFMVQFCRYAAKHFPGIQSLENFYRVMHDGEYMVLKVQHPDNPPLFAWTELEYLKHSGDLDRIRHILLEKQYLQKHFDFVNSLKEESYVDYGFMPIKAEYFPGKGYSWDGNSSGMDNSPRGKGDHKSIYWFDLAAQQGLSALYIAKLANVLGETALEKEWLAKYEELKKLVNDRFWSEEDKMYFDRYRDESGFCKVLTPAALWPLMAEMCTPEQAAALAEACIDPDKLESGPLPSVAINDPDFEPLGAYWRGGVWLPVVYMSVKALEKSGYPALADFLAQEMVGKILRTYQQVEPHTYWECYNPMEDLPATNKRNVWSRPDFCGWTALGPISLFIENMLCVRDVNALTNQVIWEPRSRKCNGITGLMMGDNKLSLIADPENGKATVECSAAFTLILNGKTINVPAGTSEYAL